MWTHLVTEQTDIQSSLLGTTHNSRCKHHIQEKKPCIFKKTGRVKEVTVYDVYKYWNVVNFEMQCQKTKSSKFYILDGNRNGLVILSSTDFIKIREKYIRKIGEKYILWSLLLYFNALTLETKNKSIGLLIFCTYSINTL